MGLTRANLQETLAFMNEAVLRFGGAGFELQLQDFEEWFHELSDEEVDKDGNKVRTIQMSPDGNFAELFERCSRKRSQLSLPIQTFLPLKPL